MSPSIPCERILHWVGKKLVLVLVLGLLMSLVSQPGMCEPTFQPLDEIQVTSTGHEAFPGVALNPVNQASFALIYVVATMPDSASDSSDIDADATGAALLLEIRNAATGAILSGPTTVSTLTGIPVEPVVAYSPDGSQFVVVWAQKITTGVDSVRNIFFRRFQSDGTPLGDPVQFNTHSANVVYAMPHLAFFADGTFLIAAEGPDAVTIGILGRRFNADGTVIDANEVTLNNTTGDEEDSPSIAILPNQNVVVAYEGDSNRQTGVNTSDVFYNILDSKLASLLAGDQNMTNSYVAANPNDGLKNPIIVARDDNSFVILERARLDTSKKEKIFGLFFDSTGTPATSSAVQISSVLEGDQQDMAGDYHIGSSWLVFAYRVKGTSETYADSTVIKFYNKDNQPVRAEEKISSSSTLEADECAISVEGNVTVIAWREVEFDPSLSETTDVFFRLGKIKSTPTGAALISVH